jgi:hypothetical protein
MQRIRIEFLAGGAVVKTFDREALNDSDANLLADRIAADSKIPHDSKRIMIERKCAIALRDASGHVIEILETKALDDADAKAIAARWGELAGKSFASAILAWR